MRLDHVAYRVEDRWAAARFFMSAFGYRVQKQPNGDDEFEIDFGEGQKAKCIALEPPERTPGLTSEQLPWVADECIYVDDARAPGGVRSQLQRYHMSPEIFVSDGTCGSIVADWVRDHGPGVHHLAYQVDSVKDIMKDWRDRGLAEFTSEEPFVCEGLTQAFTVPHPVTGMVYEFIEREDYGFCQGNVKKLMESTRKAT